MDRIILTRMNDCWSHVMRTVGRVLSVQSITRDLESLYSPHQRPAGFLTYRSSIQNTFPVSQWMCRFSALICIGAIFWNLFGSETVALKRFLRRPHFCSQWRVRTGLTPVSLLPVSIRICIQISLIKQHRTLLFLTNYNISLYWSQLATSGQNKT